VILDWQSWIALSERIKRVQEEHEPYPKQVDERNETNPAQAEHEYPESILSASRLKAWSKTCQKHSEGEKPQRSVFLPIYETWLQVACQSTHKQLCDGQGD